MGREAITYDAGEARADMLLAAANTGILAYDFIPISQ